MVVGRVVGGRYQITRLLRADHISRIYDGLDRHAHRRVTVEVLREALARDDVAASRFLAAGEAARELDHPNIATVEATGKVGDLCFVVSQAVERGSLRDILAHEGTLGPAQACSIAVQVCDALAYAHAHDVVHGGLTPADILLAADGAVTVVRFGVAVCAGTLGGPDVRYAAPEQRRPQSRDRRSDLYALGCCLYEMLVGRPPVHGHWHDHDLAQEIDTRTPTGLGGILRSLLARNPEDRYPDAGAARADLLRQQMQAPPPWPPELQPERAPMAAAAPPAAAPPAAVPPATPAGAAPAHTAAEPARQRRRPPVAVLAASGGLLAVTAIVAASQVDLSADRAANEEPAAPAIDDETEGSTTTTRATPDRSKASRRATTTSTSTSQPTTTTTTTAPPTTAAPTTTSTTTPTTTAPPTPPPPSTTEPAPPPVPGVIGMSREQAEAELARNDLDMAVRWVRVNESWAHDLVLYQSPEPGEPRPDNGVVTVWVGDAR